MHLFSIEEENDLLENVCILIEEYIKSNIKQIINPNFHETVDRDVTILLLQTLDNVFEYDISNELKEIISKGFAINYKHIYPPRSSGNTFIRNVVLSDARIKKLKEKIEYLQNIPQPEQRTPEWYEFRSKCLTASNIWKVFGSESSKNQLIYDKCKPLNVDKYNSTSLESPMHWGNKYEPLSIQLYELLYLTKVSDFGCIPHKTLKCLAASPDGINTEETSGRYGRMLEVKNIVNREITGIPKLEYWIQMQVQMEVCNLNECDFLETRFVEYADVTEFENDVDYSINGIDIEHLKAKGMMMLFMKNGQPVYEYATINQSLVELSIWQDTMMEKNSNLTWIKNIYWKLDQLSCVLVLRNKLWFSYAEDEIKKIWEIIETEKINGYEHRGAKKINKKSTTKQAMKDNIFDIDMPVKCVINIETE